MHCDNLHNYRLLYAVRIAENPFENTSNMSLSPCMCILLSFKCHKKEVIFCFMHVKYLADCSCVGIRINKSKEGVVLTKRILEILA
jgi:hypothetical protein